MKPLLFAFFSFFLLSCNDTKNSGRYEVQKSGSNQEQKQEADPKVQSYLIDDRSAGSFEIGKPIPTSSETYTIKKELQARMTEEGPTEETVYTVSYDSEAMLQLLPSVEDGSRIGEIRILSEEFRTEEGIGINSTIEEFIESYPNHKIWYTYVSGMYVIEAEGLKAQFLLDQKDFHGDLNVTSAMTPLKKEDFEDDSRIIKVRLI